MQLYRTVHFQKNPKNNSPWKKFFVFQEMKLYCFNIKKILVFPKLNHALLFPSSKEN